MKDQFYLHFETMPKATSQPEEIWRKIENYPKYSVSNLGRVRNDTTGHILTPFLIGKKGNQYFAVDLYPKRNVRVHRLVASAFIPNPDNKPEVNHIDGNHFNNSVLNLEWVTGSENCIHAYRTLGRKRYVGSENVTSKKVVRIEDGKIYDSLNEAAVDCGLKNHGDISRAIKEPTRTAGGYHWKFYILEEIA